jgi:hypothetical protein
MCNEETSKTNMENNVSDEDISCPKFHSPISWKYCNEDNCQCECFQIDSLVERSNRMLYESQVRMSYRTNDQHDQKLRKSIVLGSKALYLKAAQEPTCLCKLNSKRKEAYYIHQVLPNGMYNIRTRLTSIHKWKSVKTV